MKKIFQVIDRDGSGAISRDEVLKAIEGSRAVRNILRSQAFLRPLLDPATSAATFAKIDTDGNNELDFGEFQMFCERGLKAEAAEYIEEGD